MLYMFPSPGEQWPFDKYEDRWLDEDGKVSSCARRCFQPYTFFYNEYNQHSPELDDIERLVTDRESMIANTLQNRLVIDSLYSKECRLHKFVAVR